MTVAGVETADLIDPWLYGVLSGDSELAALVGSRIFSTFVPHEVNDRYIQFSVLSSVDVLGHNGHRIGANCVYLIKCVAATTSKDDVAPAFHRVDELLYRAEVDRPNGHISCHRETVIDLAEVVEGQAFFHLGGQYRIRATLTS